MSVLPTNAKLTRIDAVASVDVSGTASFTNGDVLDVECVIDEPTGSLAFLSWAQENQVTATIYVARDDLPPDQQLQVGDRVQANQTEDESIVYLVVKRNLRVFYEITHFELFCRVQG